MTLLDRVSALLDQAGIPHALIGGAAGVARSTFDVDLLVLESSVLSEAARTTVPRRSGHRDPARRR